MNEPERLRKAHTELIQKANDMEKSIAKLEGEEKALTFGDLCDGDRFTWRKGDDTPRIKVSSEKYVFINCFGYMELVSAPSGISVERIHGIATCA